MNKLIDSIATDWLFVSLIVRLELFALPSATGGVVLLYIYECDEVFPAGFTTHCPAEVDALPFPLLLLLV